jgi:hypothetical protein
MRYLCHIWLLVLAPAPLIGQALTAELSAADVTEIRTEAKKMIEAQLKDLLNTIADEALTEHQRDAVIFNSYLTSQNKIFYDDKAVIQDDVNPDNTYVKKGPELSVRKYLDNFKLYYGRSGSESVKITEVFVGDVEQKAYPFVKVRFKVHFLNSNRQKKRKYNDVYREAELRAEKPDKQWIVQISNIRYYIPETLASSAPVVAAAKQKTEDAVPKPTDAKLGAKRLDLQTAVLDTVKDPVKKEESVAKLIEAIPPPPSSPAKVAENEVKVERPSITTPKPELSDKKPEPILTEKKPESKPFTLPDEKKAVSAKSDLSTLQKKYSQNKTKANLLRVGAVAALAASVANYLILKNSFNQYQNQISDRNADLTTWWNSADATGNRNGDRFGDISDYKATPTTFMEFSKPGIYVSGGALVAGGVLWLLSSEPNRQAKEFKRQIEQRKKKQLSITPQWNAGSRYAGVRIVYPF